MGFILMPRGGGAELWRLRDGMLKPGRDLRTEELARDLEGVRTKLRFAQFRGELGRIQDLREPRRTTFVRASKVKLSALPPPRVFGEETTEDLPQPRDFSLGDE